MYIFVNKTESAHKRNPSGQKTSEPRDQRGLFENILLFKTDEHRWANEKRNRSVHTVQPAGIRRFPVRNDSILFMNLIRRVRSKFETITYFETNYVLVVSRWCFSLNFSIYQRRYYMWHQRIKRASENRCARWKKICIGIEFQHVLDGV